MANVKITQLPLATTPLTGTEDIPLVQGTTTKQVTVTGLFTSPVMSNPTLGVVGQADLINATGLPIASGVAGLGAGVATFLGTPSSANLRTAVTDETGTGSLVFANAPVLVAPNLGTPTFLVATNATGTAVGLIAGSAITNANLTGAVTSVGNATALGSFTSAQLITALTDETGSGSAVFSTSPTLVTPVLGTPQSGNFSTGTFTWPTFNQNTSGTAAGLSATLAIASGGTNATTAASAIENLLPAYAGNGSKGLKLNSGATALEWVTDGGGTVTSVSGTGTVNGLTLTGTVTTSGSLTLGGTLSGIPNSALTNSSITIGGTAIALGASSNALANDITIQGVTVGRGNGALATNTAVGASALQASNSGTGRNTSVGYQAGFNNTTGNKNTFLGMYTGFEVSTGVENTYVGYATGPNGIASTGSYNTGLGSQALYSNTTASNNTAVGYQAAYTNQTGARITALGTQALYSNTGGDSTAVGFQALNKSTGAVINDAFGSSALQNSTTGSGNAAFGANALNTNTTGSSNIAIGLNALISNLSGSNNTAQGVQALQANTTASQNTAVGYQAGYSISTNTNLAALGYQAAQYQTGNGITAIGSQALLGVSGSSTGGFNVAVGTQVLYANTTGTQNVGVGSQEAGGAIAPLRFNTSGSFNVALGNGALGSNTTASSNTAVGYQAGYSNQTGTENVAIGTEALKDNTTASYSTAVGFRAAENSTGQGNTAFGREALAATTTGVQNNAFGFNSGQSITTGSKNTIIGSYTGNNGGLDIRTASNYIVLSDGDGNPRGIYNSSGAYWDLQARTVLSGANNGNVAELIWTRTDASYMWANQTTMRLYGQLANTTNPNTKLLETQAGSSLAIGGANTQTGTGITFPATQSASSDANTLDDYEEGTWTPTVIGTTTAGTATYVNGTGKYTKIGRLVQFEAHINWNSGTGTGNLRVSGLPFTVPNIDTYPAVTLAFLGNLALTALNVASAYCDINTTQIIFAQSPTGGGATALVPYDAAAEIMLSGTYSV